MIGWLERARLEPEIALAGRSVPIVLKRHPTARRLTMRLAPDGSAVRITLPRWARSEEAIAFAHARREWLEAQLARVPARAVPVAGGEVRYRGRPLRIDWQAGEALALCEADMRDYCAAADLAPVPVSLSGAQKRWGSCSDKSRIRINWRLVQAPDFVRRSVVAHEVAHLVHFDHSRAFHALLARIYEGEIAAADRWLKEHGRGLYAAFG